MIQVKIIIIVYFLLVLAVGLISYFRIRTPADYFISGKNAGVFTISGSLLATILGGSAILGTIELSHINGWPAIWFLTSAAIGLLFLIPFVKRISNQGQFTLPELLGKMYGENARKIASVIIPVAWVGIVAVQIIAAAKILQSVGFMSYNNSAILAGMVFIIFTLAGGQVGILRTDTLQSIILLAGLILVFLISMFNENLPPVEPFSAGVLFNDKFSITDLLVLLLTYSVTFVVGPDIYSRVFCARNEKVATQSIIITAFFLIVIGVMLTWLGFYSVAENNQGIFSFTALNLPGWIYGLFMAALLSAIISSGSSLMNAAMILSELFLGNLQQKDALKLTRIYILLLGFAGIITALFISKIIATLLFALAVFSGSFVVPTLAGLLNLKVNKQRIVAAIIAGGLFALAGKILTIFDFSSLGNILIIGAHPVNALILFWSGKMLKH